MLVPDASPTGASALPGVHPTLSHYDEQLCALEYKIPRALGHLHEQLPRDHQLAVLNIDARFLETALRNFPIEPLMSALTHTGMANLTIDPELGTVLKYQQGPLQFEINRRKQVLYLANSENGQRQQLSVSITSKSILNPQSHFAFIKKIGAVEEVQSQALNGRGRPERTRYAFNEKVNQMQAVDYDFCHESVLTFEEQHSLLNIVGMFREFCSYITLMPSKDQAEFNRLNNSVNKLTHAKNRFVFESTCVVVANNIKRIVLAAKNSLPKTVAKPGQSGLAELVGILGKEAIQKVNAMRVVKRSWYKTFS